MLQRVKSKEETAQEMLVSLMLVNVSVSKSKETAQVRAMLQEIAQVMLVSQQSSSRIELPWQKASPPGKPGHTPVIQQ